jgi:hypothetical protein
VALTYNPSYSESRDQKDHGLKPTHGKYFVRPYLEKSIIIKGLVEWLKV